MAAIGTAFVRIQPDLDGFEKEATKGIGGAAKKAAAAFAGAFAAAQVGSYLKDSIGAASDLNETISKTEVIFGDAGQAVQDFAAGGAKSLGQSKQTVLDAAATFGTFGKAAGLGGQDLAKFSTDFVGLSTDLASFNNTTPEEAIDAIGAALRGEAEPLRQYGVLLDDATLRNEALALGLISTTKEALTPQQKILAAQAAIYKQTGDAQGDFANTSGGLANQQRILSAQLENTQAAIGQKLLPAIVAVGAFINTTLIPTVQNLWATHGPALTSAFSAVAGAVSSVTTFLWQNRDAVAALAVVVGTLVAVTKIHAAVLAIQAAGGLLKYLAATNLVTVATKVYTAVQWLLNAALTANPIGLVIAAIAGLVAGLVIAYKNSETFRVIVDAAFRAVKAAAEFAFNWVKDNWKLLLGIVTGPIGAAVLLVITHFDKIKEVAQTALGLVVGAFNTVRAAVETAKAMVGLFWDRLKDIQVPKPLRDIADLIGRIAGGLKGGAGKLKDFFGFGTGDGPGAPRGGMPGGQMVARVKSMIAGTGASISSTYRDPARNRAAGGSPTSYHLDRNDPAVDVVGPPGVLDRLHAMFRAQGGYRELIWRQPGHYDHLHVADRGGIYKGPGMVWMGAGQETFASGLAARKVADLPAGDPRPGATVNQYITVSDPAQIDLVIRRLEWDLMTGSF